MIDILQSSSEEVLGFSKRKNPDWFDKSAEEILPLPASKNVAFQAHLAHPTSAVLLQKWKKSRSITQCRLREIQNDWCTCQARKIQRYANENKAYEFYNSIIRIYGPTQWTVAPVHSTDGSTLLKDKNDILERWADYFWEMLNRINPSDPSALEELPTLPQVPELDLCPTLEEVRVAIETLKNNKAPGEDSIPSKVFKYGGPQLVNQLTKFFTLMLETR